MMQEKDTQTVQAPPVMPAEQPETGHNGGDAAVAASSWVAWQVPSRVVLAATAPGAQRLLLKDALLRTLEANGMRLSPKALNEVLQLPKEAIFAALQCGPRGEGAAAQKLRELAAPVGRRRASAGRL